MLILENQAGKVLLMSSSSIKSQGALDNQDTESGISKELVRHLRSLTRFVLVKTDEEQAFIRDFLNRMAKYEKRTWVFNAEFGLKLVSDYLKVSTLGSTSRASMPAKFDLTSNSHEAMLHAGHEAMIDISAHDPREYEHFYLITDPETWFEDPLLTRRLINLVIQGQVDPKVVKCMLFIGHPSIEVPDKLKQFISTVSYTCPIKEVVETQLSYFGDVEGPADLSIFNGLTTYEVESAITQSIVYTKLEKRTKARIDLNFIKKFRAERLKIRGVNL